MNWIFISSISLIVYVRVSILLMFIIKPCANKNVDQIKALHTWESIEIKLIEMQMTFTFLRDLFHIYQSASFRWNMTRSQQWLFNLPAYLQFTSLLPNQFRTPILVIPEILRCYRFVIRKVSQSSSIWIKFETSNKIIISRYSNYSIKCMKYIHGIQIFICEYKTGISYCFSSNSARKWHSNFNKIWNYESYERNSQYYELPWESCIRFNDRTDVNIPIE